MATSILTDVKKTLGMDESYTAFDLDVTLHINSVITTLNQLGIGPEAGFMIEDDTATWDSLLGPDTRLNAAKSYMYLRVRMLFDPPATSFLLDAYSKQILELEWRLNTLAESLPAVSQLTGFGVSPFGSSPFGV